MRKSDTEGKLFQILAARQTKRPFRKVSRNLWLLQKILVR